MAMLASGGGEMGALIRAKDWSKTALGPVETWPNSLTTMLGAVLNSRFPMSLWWGPDLLQLYNDAYRPILRDKHPALLGAPTAEVWAEIWDVVGPLASGVQAGGPATWTEDLQLFIKNGDISEETYFTFSFSAVPGDDGRAVGLLVTVQETTAKVQSERQIRMLHDLAARAAQAKSEDEACRIAFEVLAGNDLDLPFALLYVLDEGAFEPRLAGSVGWLEHAVSGSFPFSEILEGASDVLVDDLAERVGPLRPGRWNARPTQALMLPLTRAGQSMPYAIFIAGVSPHRTLDERYRRFFLATADQVANVITNARAYEAEKKRAEGLIELDRAKTAFFSNVSHEFRTPLTLILGPIENAIAREDKALRGEDLDTVHRSALRLLRLVTSLLDFARAEAGRFELSLEPLDLAVVTAGLAGSFQSLVEGAGMRLIVDCPPLPEAVYVDRTHWEKIVLNLISNAFKFTFEGEIAVELSFHGDHVQLCVRDTGTGIPESELARIFERFHRVEGARGRSFEGTGIGLALVQELVKLHGGSISVSSRYGHGTRFVVSIPTGDAHVPADRKRALDAQSRDAQSRVERANPHVLEAFHWNEPRSESDAKAPAVESPTLNDGPDGRDYILVADDNADMREYLARMLKPHWHVETVADGKAALLSVRARLPDLLLSDVMMPVMDGAALVHAIRSDPQTRAVPVILLSARAGQEALIGGLETGADDYLVKPFSARELLTRVKTHLQMARVRRAAQSQLVQSAKMASLGELVAGIAHEVNNPLAFALSHLDTVRRVLSEIDAAADSADPTHARLQWDRAYDRLREMRVGLERIHELVIKLRTFSRLDEGEKKRVSVRENIESVVMILKHRLSRGITLTTQFGEPDLVDCYPGLLNQAVMNLVSNAIDASKGGGAITITTGVQGPWFAITVSDSGSGIDASIRERILEPFFTTKPAGQGTGLGLSITYSIVQRHGGELELNPQPEGGTTAIIRIPLVQTL